jgi:hypothetical protein
VRPRPQPPSYGAHRSGYPVAMSRVRHRSLRSRTDVPDRGVLEHGRHADQRVAVQGPGLPVVLQAQKPAAVRPRRHVADDHAGRHLSGPTAGPYVIVQSTQFAASTSARYAWSSPLTNTPTWAVAAWSGRRAATVRKVRSRRYDVTGSA